MQAALETRELEEALVPNAPGEAVWAQVGKVLDGLGHPPIPHGHIVYDDKTILYVGSEDHPPPAALRPSGSCGPTVRLPEHTVLPGLIEGHAHLFLDGAPLDAERRKSYLEKPTEWAYERALERLHRIVGLGVVAVRDAGDNQGINTRLKKAYLAHDPSSKQLAYIDSAGAAIHCEGRYGGFYAHPMENCPSVECCAAQRVQAGADRLKLIVTGIINFKKGAVTAAPQLSVAEVVAFTRAARRLGVPTFAHASGADGIENAIEGGIDCIEHGFFVTPEQLSKMCDRGIVWVPTFAPVQVQIDKAAELGWSTEVVENLKRIVDRHAERLRQALALGVKIGVGSDAGSCGVPHGVGLLAEMELLEAAGMPSQAVLAAATGWGAAHLKLKERIGRLVHGAKARMIFTRHSPLQSVSNLQKEKWVVFDGKLHKDQRPGDTEGL